MHLWIRQNTSALSKSVVCIIYLSKKLDTVFQRANAGEDKTQSGNKNLQLSRDTDELFNPDNELVPHEFLEGIITFGVYQISKT